MPYPVLDYTWEIAVAADIWVLAGRAQRTLRTGAVLFALAATGAVLSLPGAGVAGASCEGRG